MHILQPKHVKLKQEEAKALLDKYNASLSQLPKIKHSDPAVPEGCIVGDILKIERKEEGGTSQHFRVVA
jgi:DNA-directed RNA polymerase I, II, and III subunit RPABC1